jgi:dipeptidyl aminopeptidase/acylaminoacyl peptidase
MRRLGRKTRLVVYPGEDHVVDTPSYVEHKYRQFVGWFDEHVKRGGGQ